SSARSLPSLRSFPTRRSSDLPRLPDSLYAERVVRRRRDRGIRLNPWRLEGRGDEIFDQAVREEVPVLVVDGLLEHRLGQALQDSAVDLSFDNHRIDLVAHVIDGVVASDLHLARLPVHIDDADMATE